MNNEALIRKLIRGSIQRAIQESVGALIVLIAIGAILSHSEVGSPRYYGCLLILVGAGFIARVVWSHALSYRLLCSHPAGDAGFWRQAFQAQARLLRLVPLWYCAPLGVGLILFIAPTAVAELVPFSIVAAIFVGVFAWVIWLNRRAALCLDETARLLTD
jgi:hypothetical protein